MANLVEFDETITGWAGGVSEAEATGTTVQDALFQVARAFPKFRLFNCEGELRSIVRVSRNDQTVDLSDRVQDGDKLRLTVGP